MKTATTAKTTVQQFPIPNMPPSSSSINTHHEEAITQTNGEVISHLLKNSTDNNSIGCILSYDFLIVRIKR